MTPLENMQFSQKALILMNALKKTFPTADIVFSPLMASVESLDTYRVFIINGEKTDIRFYYLYPMLPDEKSLAFYTEEILAYLSNSNSLEQTIIQIRKEINHG